MVETDIRENADRRRDTPGERYRQRPVDATLAFGRLPDPAFAAIGDVDAAIALGILTALHATVQKIVDAVDFAPILTRTPIDGTI